MSEYWKSTPKYWCKFCSVYVRDTKLERQNHEATGRHQGNIQRSLRGLHRDHERDEREKQRAKDEVARLNGVVGSTAKSAQSSAPSASTWRKGTPSAPVAARQATIEDRKRQMQQLADMGVAIPEEYRRDMAMAGDWQTVAVTALESQAIKGEFDEPDSKSRGVRKRKLDGEEEDDESAEHKRPQWGSTKKTFAGAKTEEADLDALLGGALMTSKSAPNQDDTESLDPSVVKIEDIATGGGVASTLEKAEPEDEQQSKPQATTHNGEAPTSSSVVFKKRKKRL